MRVDARLLGVGLAVSLLLNLFLAGVAAGRWLLSSPAAQPAARGFAPPAMVRRLPADERVRFEQAFEPHRSDMRAARRATRAARAQVEADLTASTYDRAKVETDLAALRQANHVQQTAAHAALAEAMAQLSPASRFALISQARAQRSGPPVGDGAPAR